MKIKLADPILDRLKAAAHTAGATLSNAAGKPELHIHRIARLQGTLFNDNIAINVPWTQNCPIPGASLAITTPDVLAADFQSLVASVTKDFERELESAFRRWAARINRQRSKLGETARRLLLDKIRLQMPGLERPTPSMQAFSSHVSNLGRKLQKQALIEAEGEDMRSATGLSDWISLFPAARAMKRTFKLFLGPTNSGKTYGAFQRLATAETGCYLAPLRLLALEGFDRLQEMGLPADLLTGEERKVTKGARHLAATVEMADLSTPIDVALIDEIQMIADPFRGWAWTAAVAGIPAREVIMMGSSDAEQMIRAIAARTGDEVEVHRFQRLSALEVQKHPVDLSQLAKGDALIAFTRADVMRLRQALLAEGRSVATIYGALGPEVRKHEAKRFRDGEADILVATDAIGMGLNLPIRRVVFSTLSKFDGQEKRQLNGSEIRQIAGRAGRYGLAEKGLVSALPGISIETIRKALNATPEASSDLRPWLMPPWPAIDKLSEILATDNLSEILTAFSDQVMAHGQDCRAPDLQGMAEISEAIEEADLPLDTCWGYACAPIDSRDPKAVSLLRQWALNHSAGQQNTCPRLPSIDVPATDNELLAMELAAKRVTTYLWLLQRWPDIYRQDQEAWFTLDEANSLIEQALRQKSIRRSCRSCGSKLPEVHGFAICDPCHRGYSFDRPRRNHHAGHSFNHHRRQTREIATRV